MCDTDVQSLVNGLTNRDDKYAYQCLKQLIDISNHSALVYEYFDTLLDMLDNSKSYVRTRGFLLIVNNSKWDTNNRIDESIYKILDTINDEKPITVRQCINNIPILVKNKPYLKEYIVAALHKVDVDKYKDSMKPLIVKDIRNALDTIDAL